MEYGQEVLKFDKKDGIIAVCVFLLYEINGAVFMALRNIAPYILYLVGTTVIPIVIVITIVTLKKQSIASIGLHADKLWPAVRLVIPFALLCVVFSLVLPGIIIGFNDIHIGFVLSFFTTFLFAVQEDIVFVGLIHTRLNGLIKNNAIVILLSAFIFALMHIPPWIISGRFGIHDIAIIAMAMCRLMAFHIVLISVLKKYYSLIPITIIHFLSNYCGDFVYMNDFFSVVGTAVLLVPAGFLFWQAHRHSKDVISNKQISVL